MELAAVKMDFRYDDYFPKMPNVGYETLIHDVMTGDQTLFMRADMVEEAWRIVAAGARRLGQATKPTSRTTLRAPTVRKRPTSSSPGTANAIGARSAATTRKDLKQQSHPNTSTREEQA